MKIKIAICENNNMDLLALVNCIFTLDHEIQCEHLETANRLLELYAAGIRYDLIFMTIEVPGINGLEAAMYLHKHYHGEFPLIVFVARSDFYIYDGYPYALAFMKKPIALNKLKGIFMCAITELKQKKIAIETTAGMLCFSAKDIIFFEACNGTVRILLEHGEYHTKMSLSSIYSFVKLEYFCFSHRSYLVNLEHVVSCSKDLVYLSKNKFVPLSRQRQKEFYNSIKRYSRTCQIESDF